jgi:hypothetical protein
MLTNIKLHLKCLENENDKFQKSLWRPNIIDARAHFWAAARRLRSTALGYVSLWLHGGLWLIFFLMTGGDIVLCWRFADTASTTIAVSGGYRRKPALVRSSYYYNLCEILPSPGVITPDCPWPLCDCFSSLEEWGENISCCVLPGFYIWR